MATARGDNCTKCRLGCMKCQYRGISAYMGFMPNHRDVDLLLSPGRIWVCPRALPSLMYESTLNNVCVIPELKKQARALIWRY